METWVRLPIITGRTKRCCIPSHVCRTLKSLQLSACYHARLMRISLGALMVSWKGC